MAQEVNEPGSSSLCRKGSRPEGLFCIREDK